MLDACGYGTILDKAGRFTHIFDTRTGGTASAMFSVSVVAKSGFAADGLSATMLMAPVDKRQAILKAGGGEHRPSMGQDMVKGRRTEIEFLNGLIVRKGEEIGIPTPANAALVDIVKRVERGELQADPKHILDLRLN